MKSELEISAVYNYKVGNQGFQSEHEPEDMVNGDHGAKGAELFE